MRDIFDREISDITGQLSAEYLLKSGPRVPYNPERPQDPEKAKYFDEAEQHRKKTEEFQKNIEEHFDALRDGLSTLIERDQTHVERVVEKKQEISTPRRPAQDSRPSLSDLGKGGVGLENVVLKDISDKLDKTGDWTAKFARAALHKGSLYTHDIYMFQQQMRTNQLLLELLKEFKGASGMSSKITDTEIGPDGSTLHVQTISLTELEKQFGRAPDRYNAAIQNALGEGKVSHATGGKGFHVSDPVSGAMETAAQKENKKVKDLIESDRPTRMRDLALLHGQFVGDLDQMMWKFQHMRGRAVADAVKKLSGGLLGVSAFTPLAIDIAEAVKYQQAIRQVAYQTEGITHHMGRQQEIFESRQDVLRTALASGQRLAEVQKSYVKNLQSGFKTHKDTLKVTRAALTVSTLIGSNAEEMASYLNEMHLSLAMSAEQIAAVGRGIQMTARYSKITGESLMNAVKAAKPFLDVMKQTGALSASASTSVIGMTAEMQKLGISDSMAPVMKAMMSMQEFVSAPFEARNMAAILSGGMPTLGAGAFKDKGVMKVMAARADDFLKQTFGFTTQTMDQASVEAREQANWALKSTMGVGLKDFALFAETLRKQATPLGDRLAEIDERIAKTSKYSTTERNELINQKENMRQDVRLGISTMVSEIIDRAKPADMAGMLRTANVESITEVQRSLAELIQGDRYRFQQAGITEASIGTIAGTEKALMQTYVDTISRTNERLASNTLSEDDRFIMGDPMDLVRKAFADTTGASMKDLISRMSEAEQAAAKRELEETDPVVAALGKLEAINAQIATGVGKTVSVLTNILTEVGIIALALGAMSADLMVAFGGNILGRGSRGAGRAGRAVMGGVTSSWGHGVLAESLSGLPHRMHRRGQQFRGRLNRMGRQLGGEAFSLLETFGPKGPGPATGIRGIHDGIKEGLIHFGKSIGNIPISAARSAKAVGTAALDKTPGGSYITKTLENVFDADTSVLGKFFGKTLPGYVKSAFNPKMMRDRVVAGFDFMAAKRGPFKWLKDSVTSDTRLGRMTGVVGQRASKVVGGVRSHAASIGDTIYTSAVMQSALGKMGGLKKGLSAAGGSVDRFLSGGMGGGEAVFRLARMQEKIPVWGKFAGMFGAGTQMANAAGITGLLSADAAGAAGAAASGRAVMSVATKAVLPIAIVTSAMLSMRQGLESAANAEKLFGLETENVTAAHRKAAESAGFLTGILNTLTFGLFDHWIGSTGTLTSALSIFLKDWPLLSAGIQAATIPVKVIYGVLTGMWEFTKEVFIGIWDGIKAALAPLNEVIVHFQNAFMPVWQQLSEAFQPVAAALKPFLGDMSDGASIIGAVSSVFKVLGKALGWVFRGLGMFVGMILKMVVPVITLAIDVIASVASTAVGVIKPFISAISSMFTGMVDTVLGFVKLIKGIFTLDGDVLYEASGLLYSGITGLFQGFTNFVYASFYNLFTAVPWMVLKALGTLATGILGIGIRMGKAAKTIGGKVLEFLFLPFVKMGENMESIGSRFVGVGNFFNKLLSGDWGQAWRELTKGFVSTVMSWPRKIAEALLSIPGRLYTYIVDMFKRLDQWAEANLPFYKKSKQVAQAAGQVAQAAGQAVQIGGEIVVNPAKAIGGRVLQNTDWVSQEQGMGSAVKVAVGNAILGTEEFVAAGGRKVKDAFTWMVNGARGLLGFAEGGVVTSPGLAMVGEAGPEVIIPVKDIQNIAAQGSVGMNSWSSLAPSVPTPSIPLIRVNQNDIVDAHKTGAEIFCEHLGKEHKNILEHPRSLSPSMPSRASMLAIKSADVVVTETMGSSVDVPAKSLMPSRASMLAPKASDTAVISNSTPVVNVPAKSLMPSRASMLAPKASDTAVISNSTPVVDVPAKPVYTDPATPSRASMLAAKASGADLTSTSLVKEANRIIYADPEMPSRVSMIAAKAIGTVLTSKQKPQDPEALAGRPTPIGKIVTSLSPRDLMKERGGKEVTDTRRLPHPYPDGWGEKMVDGSLVVTKDFDNHPISSSKASPDPRISLDNVLDREHVMIQRSADSAAKMISIPSKEERYNRILNEELSRMSKPAVPLIRPQDSKTSKVLTEKMTTEVIRRAWADLQAVGENTSPMSSSRTTGVTTASAYGSLFDDNGNLTPAGAAKAMMEPVPLQDIHQQIQQEVAQSQPINVAVSSPEMAEVAEDTDQMVDLLKEFNENFKKFMSMFQPSNSSGNSGVDAASTRSKIKPAGTPQYHQLSFGRFRDSAVKGVINDGVS